MSGERRAESACQNVCRPRPGVSYHSYHLSCIVSSGQSRARSRVGAFYRTYPVCVYVLLLGCALVGNVRILIQLYARDVCRALPCAARAYLFHTDFSVIGDPIDRETLAARRDARCRASVRSKWGNWAFSYKVESRKDITIVCNALSAHALTMLARRAALTDCGFSLHYL